MISSGFSFDLSRSEPTPAKPAWRRIAECKDPKRVPDSQLDIMLELYNLSIVMAWEVEYTDEFEVWWSELTEEEQESIDAAVEILEERGPALGRPLADVVRQSRHQHMKELRPTSTIRILFAFDPKRVAILLIGGDKRGSWNRWYDQMVPVADALYDEHLADISKTSERRE
jgi:hypothetical protein